MQVYRGLDIGTAKPTPAERVRIPHHLIDLVDPEETFSVADFQAAGVEVLDRLAGDDRPALITGGSGLHFRALVDPLRFRPTDPDVRAEVEGLASGDALRALLEADPAAADHVDVANPRRVVRALEIYRLTGETPSQRAEDPEAEAVRTYRPARPVAIAGIDPGEALRSRVERRLQRMVALGFLDEVRALEPRLGPTASQAVGYRQLLPVVRGARTLDEGIRRVHDATTALAHRQRVFFRRDPRVGWTEWHDDPAERERRVLRTLEEAGWTS
jgi:tRNA dimethylallyltransferase